MPNHDAASSAPHVLAHHAMLPPRNHMHWLPHRLCLMCTPAYNLHGYTHTAPREIEPHPGKKCAGPCCKAMTFGTSARVRSGTSPARAQNIAAALHPCFDTELGVVCGTAPFSTPLCACGLLRAPHAPRHAINAPSPCCPQHLAGMPLWNLPCLHTRRAPHSHARTHLHTRRVTHATCSRFRTLA